MARWEKKQRIGDVVALFGQFAAVGQLAGTVRNNLFFKCHLHVHTSEYCRCSTDKT